MGEKLVMAAVVEAGDEPVTLAEARLHVRIDADPEEAHPEDAMLQSLITAARQAAEEFAERIFTIGGIYEAWADGFGACMDLPRAPVGGIVLIQYDDADGVVQMLPEGVLHLYPHPSAPRLLLVPGQSLVATRAAPGCVRVRFTGGHTADDGALPVPRAVVQAMLLTVGHLYANREDVVTGTVSELPVGAKALLWPYRRGLGV